MRKYDAFISYAIEDKHTVAEKITEGLKEKGIDVFFVGKELQVGDDIPDVIYSGLEKSKYGIVILSPDYIRSWPVIERSQFLQRERQEKDMLLFPVWHRITYEQVKKLYPELADRHGLSTKDGMDYIIGHISTVIEKKKRKRRLRYLRDVMFVGIFLVLCGFYISNVYAKIKFRHALPSNQFVESAVLKRITDYQNALDNQLKKTLAHTEGKKIKVSALSGIYDHFIVLGKYSRENYSFTNGNCILDSRKKILGTGIPVDDAPYSYYGFAAPVAWVLADTERLGKDTIFDFSFALGNSAGVKFTIDTVYFSGRQAHAQVSYRQYLRYIYCYYKFSSGKGNIRHQQTHMEGFKPREEYVFEVRNNAWTLALMK